MFNCEKCGRTTEDKEKPHKVYMYREKQYENYRTVYDKDTRRKQKEKYTTTGKEISAEFTFCKDCFKEHEGASNAN